MGQFVDHDGVLTPIEEGMFFNLLFSISIKMSLLTLDIGYEVAGYILAAYAKTKKVMEMT